VFSRNHTATAAESTSDTPTHAAVPLSGLRLRLSRVNKPIVTAWASQQRSELA
jgi:hypothetical protein